MYTRLIIAVLIVATVVVNTATAQNTTTAPLNATTTALPNGTSSVTTIAPSNGVTTNATTAAPSGSTGPSNTTASNVTTTTQSPTTTAITVGALPQTAISKAGCGTQQLCLTQPTGCDPSSASCYFISSQLLSGQNYLLGLSGTSPGYIAVALSTASSVGSNDTTYICANNGTVQFFLAYLNGNVLQTTSTASVSSVNGTASGNKIQCLINATLPAGSTKALNFRVGFLTGNYTNGTLGNATIIFQKTADLSNPASHAITFKHSLTQAVLIVMVALRLTM